MSSALSSSRNSDHRLVTKVLYPDISASCVYNPNVTKLVSVQFVSLHLSRFTFKLGVKKADKNSLTSRYESLV